MRKILLAVSLALFGVAFSYAQDQVVVSGTIENSKRDTVKIVLTENAVVRKGRTFYVKLENGSFRQTIPLKQPAYLYVNENSNYVTGFVAPGDDIDIKYDANDLKNTLALSGKARAKFEWLLEMYNAKLNQQLVARAKSLRDQPLPFDQLYKYIDSIGAYFGGRLEQIKDIDPLSAHILKAQVNGTMRSNFYFGTTYIFSETIAQTLEKRQAQLTPNSRNVLANLLQFEEENYNSPLYVNSIYNVLSVNYENLVFEKKMSPDLALKYRFIDTLLPVKLKVPVMTMFLDQDISKNNQGEDIQRAIEYVFFYKADPIYKEYIDQQLLRTVLFKKGSPAPAFSLTNDKGQKISLASFKGKVVYMDFWFASCAPCHSLFTEIKPVKEHFKDKDVVFLTISIDDRNIWKEALKKYKIPGYHAFTEDKERAHPIIEDYKVQGYPSTFLIDRNGNIFLARPSNNPDELKNQITEALQ